jgi:hypothetical protein
VALSEEEKHMLAKCWAETNNKIPNILKFFDLTCKQCGSKKVVVITEHEHSGYCETCASCEATTVIKCCECGQAVVETDY